MNRKIAMLAALLMLAVGANVGLVLGQADDEEAHARAGDAAVVKQLKKLNRTEAGSQKQLGDIAFRLELIDISVSQLSDIHARLEGIETRTGDVANLLDELLIALKGSATGSVLAELKVLSSGTGDVADTLDSLLQATKGSEFGSVLGELKDLNDSTKTPGQTGTVVGKLDEICQELKQSFFC